MVLFRTGGGLEGIDSLFSFVVVKAVDDRVRREVCKIITFYIILSNRHCNRSVPSLGLFGVC